MQENPGAAGIAAAGREARRAHLLRQSSVAILFALTLSACASGGGGSGGSRRDSNVLRAEDLTDVSTLSIYDAIQRLRPSWLRPRGVTSVMAMSDQLPAVMVDNAFHPVDYLRSVQVANAETVRYIDGRDATTRWGTGYVNGIIEVVMAGRSR